MIGVDNRGNESIESLIKRFSQKVQRAGVLREFREHTYFKKPSDIRRLKRLNKAIKSKRRGVGTRGTRRPR